MDQTSKNIDFGVELENLMEKYPRTKRHGALIIAVRNLKKGNPANTLIRGDWDKYGTGAAFMGEEVKFANELEKLLIKYGTMSADGKWLKG